MRDETHALQRALVLAAVATGLAVPSQPARAGGFWIWEVGNAPDIGNAGAAWGAGSEDAATAWLNPAAMTVLERSEISGQLTPSFYRYRFDRDDATTVSGGSGANTSFAPLLGAAGVWAANERLRLGIATGGLAGGSLDYGDDWSGRYLVTQISLTVLGVAPAIAYRVTDWLSVGGSANLALTTLDQRARVNNLLPGQDDGRLQLEDRDLGFGGVFGLLVEPLDGTRLAVTYRTPVKFDLEDRGLFRNLEFPLNSVVERTGLADARVRVDLEIPQQVLIGVSHEITDELTLVANADWEDWSEYGAFELSLASQRAGSVEADIQSKDTWHVGVGLRWRPRPRWLLTTGFSYDSSMFSDSDRAPSAPIDRQIRVGGGVQYELRENLAVGFAYEYMNGGDAPLSAGGGPLTGTLSGEYDQNELHFFTLSVNWSP